MPDETKLCLFCRKPLPDSPRNANGKVVGRPRLYCADAPCRARYHEKRKFGYDLFEVIVHHGDVCYLCGEKVNLDGRGPATPCIDHVLPTAAGGNNEMGNLRLVHLRCNLQKGDRLFCSNCGHDLGLRF